ncbi:BnaA03g52220D [Brassica napus]|uniref:BnaA03g52220D protein n=1 Tax=Brassica napus TaxID=3708 RepID=A0A078FKM5_BRANA|nr:BnaA03g52220D [Brassica napus]
MTKYIYQNIMKTKFGLSHTFMKRRSTYTRGIIVINKFIYLRKRLTISYNHQNSQQSLNKKPIAKLCKGEKTIPIRMKRKYLTPHGVSGHQKSAQSESKQRRLSFQAKPIPLSFVFARLLNDVSKTSMAPKSNEYANFPNKQDVFHQNNYVKSNHRTRCHHVGEGTSDEYDDLEFECSSQERSDTDDSNDEDSTELVQEKDNQSKRVSVLAALFKKSFTEVKPKVKPTSPKEDDYVDEGDPTESCGYCGAIMWYGERIRKSEYRRKPIFTLCCMQGQVQLPLLKKPPDVLMNLLTGTDKLSKHFQKNTRPYNMIFSFTSLGRGPQMLVLHGENYHLMGSLTPPEGGNAKGRKNARSERTEDGLKKDIILPIMKMLNDVNPYVAQFRSASERFRMDPEKTFHMRIVSRSDKDGRTYNMPTASEVAALIPGDFNLGMDKRDIVLQHKSGRLTRIDEIHISYLALQYPLLFVYGEDGFRVGIKKGLTEASKKLKKDTISMRQFFAFRMQERPNESHVLLYSRRLFQQFIVDAYTTIESNRLRYLKLNQTCLRSDTYDSIKESQNAGKSDMNEQGEQFLLPATFTGGPRYMKNMYLDAMAICKHFGFPDLFITFTCNPKWPELTRFLQKRGLNSDDRPDIICRIFKMKLDSLMNDLTKKNILGKTSSCKFFSNSFLFYHFTLIHLREF